MDNLKVLIIEDEFQIMESLTLCFELRWHGATVIQANEGEKGLELSETETPDVIILDLGLPDIDGYEVLRQIRSFSNVPVVILTARGDESDIVKGLEIGADDYVTKPFEPDKFLARVKSVMCRSVKIESSRLVGGLSCRSN